jgi:hypothetical protein
MTKRLLLILAIIALTVGAIGASFLKNHEKAKFVERLKKYPRDGKWKSVAFRNHLDNVTQALSTREGQRGGPHGAIEQKLAALAYPDSDIPLVRLKSAEHAARTARLRGLPRGRGRNGWVSVGPSFAKVPDFEFRDTTVYTPNGYEASGRTTTIAIAPNCTKASCRIWIGTAGGGIWRTKKGLSKNPNWEYLSGSFGINTTGILYLDPNDPTANTIYAGTGEPNGSGDSVHGVGIYKSTNGGNTWTGPLGSAEFAGRAVGSIAIHPENPNIIYAASGRGFHGVSSVSGGQISIVVPGAAMWGLYKSTDGGTTWTFIHNGGTSVENVPMQQQSAQTRSPIVLGAVYVELRLIP